MPPAAVWLNPCKPPGARRPAVERPLARHGDLLKIRARRGVLITRRLAACDCLSPVFLGRRRIGIARYCDGARSIKGRPMGTNFEQNPQGERLG